ncbi:LLM class F420-dependent oxidoreductase [Rhodococcus sp. NPDC003318]|uniref:LLM class F420-dependent oxidoreductase n=1 Tax=Rhodococcus sp. NPDC003318 TaxID=3364503 RepID=UPI003673B9BF
MRIGIVTPVLIQHPATRGPWEAAAGIDEVAAIAESADRLGYHHLTCSEHVAVPTAVASERGGTYFDPLSTLGFLAARTHRIRLATQVLVLGYHHPLEIAKRYGTLDRISGGRVVLGLGVGSLREEFDLLGATFAGRGDRADDALRALRASLGRPNPTYRGEFYDFDDVVVQPHAAQERVPLWIGGRSARSLRRAIELGDGWVPFGLGLGDLTEMLARTTVPDGMAVVLGTSRPLDPAAAPDTAVRALTRLRDAGATIAGVTLAATSATHYCDQLSTLKHLAQAVDIEFD